MKDVPIYLAFEPRRSNFLIILYTVDTLRESQPAETDHKSQPVRTWVRAVSPSHQQPKMLLLLALSLLSLILTPAAW